eukprot:g5030.t1
MEPEETTPCSSRPKPPQLQSTLLKLRQNSNLRSWDRHFFRVKPDKRTLSYYRDETYAEGGKIGSIPLDDIQSITRIDSNHFSLKVNFLLRADQKLTTDRWVERLEEFITKNAAYQSTQNGIDPTVEQRARELIASGEVALPANMRSKKGKLSRFTSKTVKKVARNVGRGSHKVRKRTKAALEKNQHVQRLRREMRESERVQKMKHAYKKTSRTFLAAKDRRPGATYEEFRSWYLRTQNVLPTEYIENSVKGEGKTTDSSYMRTLFNQLDTDNTGTLDKNEVKQLAKLLGDRLTGFFGFRTARLDAAFAEMDTDNSGQVNFDEFVDWWLTVHPEQSVEWTVEDRIRYLFNKLDEDNNKRLSLKELNKMSEYMGKRLSSRWKGKIYLQRAFNDMIRDRPSERTHRIQKGEYDVGGEMENDEEEKLEEEETYYENEDKNDKKELYNENDVVASEAQQEPEQEPLRTNQGVPTAQELSDALVAFYESHAPDRVRKVPKVLKKYKGKEGLLYEMYMKKYNEAPQILLQFTEPNSPRPPLPPAPEARESASPKGKSPTNKSPTNKSPRAKSPRAKSPHSPKAENTRHSPKAENTRHSPKAENTRHSPKAENTRHSPKAENTRHSPKAENTRHSPKADNTHRSPRAENIRHSPKADNTRHSPKAENTRHSPKAENTRHSPKAEKFPDLSAAKRNSSRSPSPRAKSPQSLKSPRSPQNLKEVEEIRVEEEMEANNSWDDEDDEEETNLPSKEDDSVAQKDDDDAGSWDDEEEESMEQIPDLKSKEKEKEEEVKFCEGDEVVVYDPDCRNDRNPPTDWKKALVIELCEDGDIAVRYEDGEEEEVAPEEVRMQRRGKLGRKKYGRFREKVNGKGGDMQ